MFEFLIKKDPLSKSTKSQFPKIKSEARIVFINDEDLTQVDSLKIDVFN